MTDATAPGYTNTALWRRLSAQTSDTSPLSLWTAAALNTMETLLKDAGTAPQAFTLHDAEHSRRVAERMVEVMPAGVLDDRLSVTEVALLLLAACGHDIGMSPNGKLANAIVDYLGNGQPALTDEREAKELRRWLDTDQNGLTPGKDVTPEQARRLTAHYCRHRHNAWSGDWLRENLPAVGDAPYDGAVRDLTTICLSHHQGYDDLRRDAFRPLQLPDGTWVHRRYLACVLRVADYLDLDPQRVPEVVLKRRDIEADSLVHWAKDRHACVTISPTREITVRAELSTAREEKLLRDIADGMAREAELCALLRDEHLLDYHGGDPAAYGWDLVPRVERGIGPAPDTYKYIDGSFRPDTERLLEILGGVELYGDPMCAVRELLQNAFDAVRERIAYQRLEHADAGNREWAEHYGKEHLVELRLEEREGATWLVCRDTGAGMSRKIITNALLVSGRARRSDILELERRCEEHGFSTARTARFGIGALSYFMIADRVKIVTARNVTGQEHEGWKFVTEGVGDFGELRPWTAAPGTTVSLRLSKPEAVAWELAERIREWLVRVPCRFRLVVPGTAVLELGPGWTLDEPRLNELLRAEIWRAARDHSPHDPVRSDRALWAATEDLLRTVEWRHSEADLPRGLGRLRIAQPLFRWGVERLPYGLLADPKSRRFAEVFARRPFILSAAVPSRWAWRGMQVGLGPGTREEPTAAFFEADLRADSIRITADRKHLIDAVELSAKVRGAAYLMYEQLIANEASSATWIPSSHGWSCRAQSKGVEPLWLCVDQADSTRWQWRAPLLPATTATSLVVGEQGATRVAIRRATHGSAPVDLVAGQVRLSPELRPWGVRFPSPPSRIVWMYGPTLAVVPLWTELGFSESGAHGPLTAMAPEHSELIGVSLQDEDGIFAINRSNPIVAMCAIAAQRHSTSATPLPAHIENLQSSLRIESPHHSLLINSGIQAVQSYVQVLHQQIQEFRRSDHWRSIWAQSGTAGTWRTGAMRWLSIASRAGQPSVLLYELAGNDIEVVSDPKEITRRLPPPEDDEWLIDAELEMER